VIRDGQQQEAHRGAHQDAQVDAPRALRLGRLVVRDQREGGQREQLVEQEERGQVTRERDAQGREDGEREANEEARLVLLVVLAQVAGGVDAGDGPERGGDQRIEQAERLHPEEQRHPRQRGAHQLPFGQAPRHHGGVEQPHGDERGHADHPGDRLAHVGALDP
jgi:hypothetical protein